VGERRYSSYSFITSALEAGEWSASRPGRALPPWKEPPVPILMMEAVITSETVSFCQTTGRNIAEDSPI
jgi:hypothetical protein